MGGENSHLFDFSMIEFSQKLDLPKYEDSQVLELIGSDNSGDLAKRVIVSYLKLLTDEIEGIPDHKDKESLFKLMQRTFFYN